jgi:hypothetical protein
LETITSLCEKYSSTFIQKLVICAKVKTKPQGYYKESTPFCRKTIINHCRVKQITENILELNLIKITFILSLFNQNILNARRKFFKAAIHTKSRDHIDYFCYTQCWLLVHHVHILLMLETIDSIVSPQHSSTTCIWNIHLSADPIL